MTPGEFSEIAKSMRQFGISKLKMGDVDIELQSSYSNKYVDETLKDLKEPAHPIEQKVEQLSSLLKLGDSELVDNLFPDHTKEEALI